jgi:hypothetical protein
MAGGIPAEVDSCCHQSLRLRYRCSSLADAWSLIYQVHPSYSWGVGRFAASGSTVEADSSCRHVYSRDRCSDLVEARSTINQVYSLCFFEVGMFTCRRIATEDVSRLLCTQLKIPLWRPRRHLEYDSSGIIFIFLESWYVHDWWIHDGNVIDYTYPLCSWRVGWLMGAGSAAKLELEPPSKFPQDTDVASSLGPGTQPITHILCVPGESDGSWALDLPAQFDFAGIQVPQDTDAAGSLAP